MHADVATPTIHCRNVSSHRIVTGSGISSQSKSTKPTNQRTKRSAAVIRNLTVAEQQATQFPASWARFQTAASAAATTTSPVVCRANSGPADSSVDAIGAVSRDLVVFVQQNEQRSGTAALEGHQLVHVGAGCNKLPESTTNSSIGTAVVLTAADIQRLYEAKVPLMISAGSAAFRVNSSPAAVGMDLSCSGGNRTTDSKLHQSTSCTPATSVGHCVSRCDAVSSSQTQSCPVGVQKTEPGYDIADSKDSLFTFSSDGLRVGAAADPAADECVVDSTCANSPTRSEPAASRIQRIAREAAAASGNVLAVAATSSAGNKTFSCQICSRDFTSEKYLNMHVSIHQQQPQQNGNTASTVLATGADVPLSPGTALATSTISPTLETQLNQHQPTALIAQSGAVMTSTKANLPNPLPPPIRRIKAADGSSGGGQWTCQLCEKTFAQNSNYKNHIRTHSNERPFVCEICSIGFKERYHLKKHVLFKHSDEMREECRICGKRFKDSTAVRAHERTHSDQRPYACLRCDKTFKTSECLWHHENRSKTCGKSLGELPPQPPAAMGLPLAISLPFNAVFEGPGDSLQPLAAAGAAMYDRSLGTAAGGRHRRARQSGARRKQPRLIEPASDSLQKVVTSATLKQPFPLPLTANANGTPMFRFATDDEQTVGQEVVVMTDDYRLDHRSQHQQQQQLQQQQQARQQQLLLQQQQQQQIVHFEDFTPKQLSPSLNSVVAVSSSSPSQSGRSPTCQQLSIASSNSSFIAGLPLNAMSQMLPVTTAGGMITPVHYEAIGAEHITGRDAVFGKQGIHNGIVDVKYHRQQQQPQQQQMVRRQEDRLAQSTFSSVEVKVEPEMMEFLDNLTALNASSDVDMCGGGGGVTGSPDDSAASSLFDEFNASDYYDDMGECGVDSDGCVLSDLDTKLKGQQNTMSPLNLVNNGQHLVNSLAGSSPSSLSTTTSIQQCSIPPSAHQPPAPLPGVSLAPAVYPVAFTSDGQLTEATTSLQRPYRCDQCDADFKLKVHLKKHILYKHSTDYPCECSICGKKFKDSSAVRLHERIHSTARPFPCQRCGKCFKTRENLWGHRHRGPCDRVTADTRPGAEGAVISAVTNGEMDFGRPVDVPSTVSLISTGDQTNFSPSPGHMQNHNLNSNLQQQLPPSTHQQQQQQCQSTELNNFRSIPSGAGGCKQEERSRAGEHQIVVQTPEGLKLLLTDYNSNNATRQVIFGFDAYTGNFIPISWTTPALTEPQYQHHQPQQSQTMTPSNGLVAENNGMTGPGNNRRPGLHSVSVGGRAIQLSTAGLSSTSGPWFTSAVTTLTGGQLPTAVVAPIVREQQQQQQQPDMITSVALCSSQSSSNLPCPTSSAVKSPLPLVNQHQIAPNGAVSCFDKYSFLPPFESLISAGVHVGQQQPQQQQQQGDLPPPVTSVCSSGLSLSTSTPPPLLSSSDILSAATPAGSSSNTVIQPTASVVQVTADCGNVYNNDGLMIRLPGIDQLFQKTLLPTSSASASPRSPTLLMDASAAGNSSHENQVHFDDDAVYSVETKLLENNGVNDWVCRQAADTMQQQHHHHHHQHHPFAGSSGGGGLNDDDDVSLLSSYLPQLPPYIDLADAVDEKTAGFSGSTSTVASLIPASAMTLIP